MKVFHLVEPDAWQEALDAGRYAPESLATEGFIHLSFEHQLLGTANRFYKQVPDLLVAVFDGDAFGSALVIEDTSGHGEFPHLYRALDPDDALEVFALVNVDDDFVRSETKTRDFAHYDTRGYERLDVVAGYARWASVYDERMDDRLDLELFARSVMLREALDGTNIVDLACGTGRVGRWLLEHGADSITGVDLSAEMLVHATQYAQLVEASILDTGLPAGSFAGATSSMALCHVADLNGFFAEAARLLPVGGFLFIVDFHPFFLMNGIPTHFDDPATGESVAIQDHVHAVSDYFRLAQPWFDVVEFDERFVDDAWVAERSSFAKFLGWPMALSFGYVRR